MSEREAPPPPAAASGMVAVTDHQIAEELEFILRNSNSFTSFNGVVQQLESKFGVSFSHRVDFIHTQIQHFFRLLQSENFMPQQSYSPFHHTFNLPETPSMHAPPNFTDLRRQQLQPQTQYLHTPTPTQSVVFKEPTVINFSESTKESAPPTTRKRRGGLGGLNKLCGVSPELQTIVGQPALARTEIVKQLWAYIRKNNLQDPNNKRKIICNDELRRVFETDCTDMFKMNKLLAKHILPLEPTNRTTEIAKKSKVDLVEPESKSDDAIPIVIISDALANFFGTDEREMSRAEVLRQMWEYIRVNHLEDPLNPTAIICDAKLQELLGCESISALGIPETLAERHLSKKS